MLRVYEVTKKNLNATSNNPLDFFFRFFFILSLALTVLSLNYVWGVANVNWLERTLLLMSASVFVIKNKPSSILVFLGFFLILITIFICGFLTEYHLFSWKRLIQATTALFSILLFYAAVPSEKDSLFALKTIGNLTPVIVIYGVILHLWVGRELFSVDHTGASRFAGGTIFAFMAAAAYASSIAYSLLFLYLNERKYLILTFLSILVCILTGTRMPSACALLCATVILMSNFKSHFARVTFIGFTFFLLIIFLMTLGDQILIRFNSSSDSGRSLLWDSVMNWVDIFPYTGVGYGHHTLLIPEYVQKITGTEATHNEYIRLAGELGYIGSAVFLFGIFLIYFFSSRLKPMSQLLLSLIVVSTFFLYSYSDNTLLATYCLFAPLAYSLSRGLVKVK